MCAHTPAANAHLQPETGKGSSSNSMYVYTYIGGDNAIYAINVRAKSCSKCAFEARANVHNMQYMQ